MSSSSEQQKTNDGDHNNTNNRSLKKGTWSKDEDKILVDYVKQYGDKKWNAVQKITELARDGKSCRLRWNNHLKPGVRKGKFSEDEQKQVILMKELGIEWCKMAKELPGRSDNDIKNFWNARERKLMNKKLKLSGSKSLSDDHKLNDNRENSLSGSTSKQVDDSQVKIKKHNYDEMNENNYSKQLPNLFDDVPNKQLPKFPKLVDDSNMHVGSTSISNHTTPSSWINRASIGNSFMHGARVPNLSTLPPYSHFQNMYNPLPSIEHNLHRKYPSRYDEINQNNSQQLPNLFDVPNMEFPNLVDDSNMLYSYNNLGSTSSISQHNRAGIETSSMHLPNQNMDYSFPLLEHSLYGNNSELLSNSFQVPNKELPMLVDDSNMLNNNVGSASTSNHTITTPTWTNRDGNGTSSKQFTMVPNQLPPHSYVQNMEIHLPSNEYLQNPLPQHSYVQNMEFQLPSNEYLQNPLPPHSYVQNMEFQLPSNEYLQNPLPPHSYVQNMESQLPSDEYFQNLDDDKDILEAAIFYRCKCN